MLTLIQFNMYVGDIFPVCTIRFPPSEGGWSSGGWRERGGRVRLQGSDGDDGEARHCGAVLPQTLQHLRPAELLQLKRALVSLAKLSIALLLGPHLLPQKSGSAVVSLRNQLLSNEALTKTGNYFSYKIKFYELR